MVQKFMLMALLGAMISSVNAGHRHSSSNGLNYSTSTITTSGNKLDWVKFATVVAACGYGAYLLHKNLEQDYGTKKFKMK